MPKRPASEDQADDPNKEAINSNHVNLECKNQLSNMPLIKRSKIIPFQSLSNTVNKKLAETENTKSESAGSSNKIYKVVSINGQILLMEHDASNFNLDTENDSKNNIDNRPVVDKQEEQQNECNLDVTNENNAETNSNHAGAEQKIEEKLDLTIDSDSENENTHQDMYGIFTENRAKSIYDSKQENANLLSKNMKKTNQNNLIPKKPQLRHVYRPKNQNMEPPRILNLENQLQQDAELNTKTDELEILLDNQLSSAIIRPANTLSQSKEKSALPHIKKQGASKEADISVNSTRSLNKSDVNNIIENFVDYFADIMNYKWYNDQDILIYGKKGTAMALVHEAKYKAYKANKAKLEELNAAMEIIKRNNKLISNEKKKIETALKKYQDEIKEAKNTIVLLEDSLNENLELKELINKQNNEMKELRTLKQHICKAFSEAQICMLTHQMRSKCLWTDEDMKRAVFLYQIVSPKAYTYLKTTMKFPLPCKNTIRNWMIEKNIYVKPSRKRSKETGQDVNDTTVEMLNTNESKILLAPDTNVSIETVNESDIQAEDASHTSINNGYDDDTTNNTLNESNTDTEYNVGNNINTDTNSHSIQNVDENQSTAVIIESNFHAQYAQNVVLLQDTNKEVTETEQAINMITENQQICHINGQDILTTPAYSDGEMILVYLDDNNVNEDYVIEDNCVEGEIYAQDDNTANDDNDACGGNDAHEDDNVHDDDNAQNNNDVHENNDINDESVQDDSSTHNNKSDITLTSVEDILKWDLNYMNEGNEGKKNLHMISRMINWKLMCQLCLKPFTTEEELRQHVPVHYFNTYCTTYLDAEKPYQCEFCHELVVQKTSLVRHHCLHLGITSYNCWYPGCTYVGRNRELMSSHVVKHYPRKYSCPSCEAAFVTRRALRSHYKRRHSTRGLHRCELCNAIRKSDYTFHLHMRSHNKPPRFKCLVEGCSEAFYSRRSLGVHKLTHMSDTRPYKCPHCPLATYAHEFLLKRHLENHEKYRLAQCSKCQQIFDTYTDYYTHIKSDEHNKVAKYTCACKQQFSTMKKFKNHKAECQSAIDADTGKKRRRRKIVNMDVGIKKVEVQTPHIIEKENSEQLAVYFDENVVRATYQRNKAADNCPHDGLDSVTNLHEENSQSSISKNSVPENKIQNTNTVSNEVLLQKMFINNGQCTTMNQDLQQKVTVEPVFSSQNVTLLPDCNENDKNNLIQGQKLIDVSKIMLSKQHRHNQININADKHIKSRQKPIDSILTAGDNEYANNMEQEVEQNEVLLFNTAQPDMPLIDPDVQSLPQIHTSPSTSKSNDVIGALMKESGCMEQPSQLLEGNLTPTDSTSQKETAVEHSIKQVKLTVGPKIILQNMTLKNGNNTTNKIPVQRINFSNKTCPSNVIAVSKTKIVPIVPVVSNQHVEINKKDKESPNHPPISVQNLKGAHIVVGIKGSPQKNKVLEPTSETDMHIIDTIEGNHNIQHHIESLHEVNQSGSEIFGVSSPNKSIITGKATLWRSELLEQQHNMPLTNATQKNVREKINQKLVILESVPTTSSLHNASTTSYETDKNDEKLIPEHKVVPDKTGQAKLLTVLKPNILKKSSLVKFKIKPISKLMSNSQNSCKVIKEKMCKVNIGTQSSKYIPKQEQVIHSALSAQTLKEQLDITHADQI